MCHHLCLLCFVYVGADQLFRRALPCVCVCVCARARVCVCVCPIVCDLETLTYRRSKPERGFGTREKNIFFFIKLRLFQTDLHNLFW